LAERESPGNRPPTPSRIFSYEGYVRMLSEGTEPL